MHDAFTVSDTPIVAGLQDRVESLLLYGELRWCNSCYCFEAEYHNNTASKLFIGCQNGSLHVYTLDLSNDPDNGIPNGASVLIARSSK